MRSGKQRIFGNAGAMIALADEVQTHRSRRDEVHRRVAAKYGWDSVACQVAAFLEELCSRK